MFKLMQSAENIFAWLQPATYVGVAAALIINGIKMATGGEEGREKAKKAIPYVAIGCIIVLLAVDIAKELVGKVVI